MQTTWTDATGQRHIWCYEGPIVRRGEITIARLSVKKFRHNTVSLAGHTTEQKAVTPNRDYDPCFIIFYNDTDNWSVRPGITSGFSESNNCYGGIHIIKNKSSTVSDNDIESLFKGCFYLEYDKIRKKLDSIIHGPLRDFNE